MATVGELIKKLQEFDKDAELDFAVNDANFNCEEMVIKNLAEDIYPETLESYGNKIYVELHLGSGSYLRDTK